MKRRVRHLAIIGAVIVAAVPVIAIETAALLGDPPQPGRALDVSPVVLDRDDAVLRAYLASDGRWRLRLALDDLPPGFADLLVAYEDRRYHEHHGVDYRALIRSALQWLRRGRPVSGGSTLSMQTARLLEGGPRTLVQKWRQIVAARRLERRYSKVEILRLYLTLAPYGGNIEGLRAASLVYFRKEPKHLTLPEQFLLIALPQAPERRRPDRDPQNARKGRQAVIDRLVAHGAIDRTAAVEAAGAPLPERFTPMLAAHHLADQLRHLPAATTGEIRTHIDRPLQLTLENLARRTLSDHPPDVNATFLVVRNSDRAVIAYVGGADFFSEARAGQMDLTRAIRSPGSALKPFIYGMGFEARIIHPETILTDIRTRFGDYEPRNFTDGYEGDMTIRDALVRSINTGAVSVLAKLQPERFVERLRAAGMALAIADEGAESGLPIALGAAGVTLFDMARLFAGLAERGLVRDLSLIRGETRAPSQPPHRILEAEAVWAVTDILADVRPPPGFTRRQTAEGGRRIAFKTGTSYGFRDAWAIGYDLDHTVAVWIGRPDGGSNLAAYGITAAAPALFRIFDQIPAPTRDVAGPAPIRFSGGPPPGLQRFGQKQGEPVHPLRVVFPTPDANLLVRPRETVPLIVQGGTPPYQWAVDEKPVGNPVHEARTWWVPEGPGAAAITAVDAEGNRTAVTVWVEVPD